MEDVPWLDEPVADANRIGDEWIGREATRLGGRVSTDGVGGGLLASMKDLEGPTFDPAALRPETADFDEPGRVLEAKLSARRPCAVTKDQHGRSHELGLLPTALRPSRALRPPGRTP